MIPAEISNRQAAERGAWINALRRALERGELKVNIAGRGDRRYGSAAELAAQLDALRAAGRDRQRRAMVQFVQRFGVFERGQRIAIDLVAAADVVYAGVAIFLDDDGNPVLTLSTALPRRPRWLPPLRGWLTRDRSFHEMV